MDLSKKDDFTILSECPHCHGKLELKIGHAPILEDTIRERIAGNPELTILCITRGNKEAYPFLKVLRKQADALGAFFLVVVDTKQGKDRAFDLMYKDIAHMVGMSTSDGYVESILSVAYNMTNTTYVLRVDDDEAISIDLFNWLQTRKYISSTKWRIPTMALWPDGNYFIVNKPLFPDPHLRLTTWRHHPIIHDVHGAMDLAPDAPAALLHFKYISKNYESRKALANHYENLKTGAGYGDHMPFTLPEKYYKNGVLVAPVGKGLASYDEKDLLFCDWAGKLRDPNADEVANFLGSVG